METYQNLFLTVFTYTNNIDSIFSRNIFAEVYESLLDVPQKFRRLGFCYREAIVLSKP